MIYKPDDAQHCIESVWYKVCNRWGYVWYHVNGHWQRSAKTEKELFKVRKEPSQGTKTGKGHNPNTKQKLALDTITTYGSMTREDMVSMTSMSYTEVKNALKALKGRGDLELSKITGLYSLPTETKFEMFTGLTL